MTLVRHNRRERIVKRRFGYHKQFSASLTKPGAGQEYARSRTRSRPGARPAAAPGAGEDEVTCRQEQAKGRLGVSPIRARGARSKPGASQDRQ